MFSQHFNVLTGKMEWESHMESGDEYDYHQEIARSGYADMLHDSERNQKYYKGLQAAFAELRANGREIIVLDIGAGTGLLSMMAVKLGADDVTACEAFRPMAKCAKEILVANECADKVRLIPKRSTELTVGPDGDMPRRANVLVTEVFDTELIGEGAIGTFNHAHAHLLEEICFVVPSRARVYVQLVESDFLRRWHSPFEIRLDIESMEVISPPSEVSSCTGSANVLDLQMSQLPKEKLRVLTDPEVILRLDFTSSSEIRDDETLLKQIKAIDTGKCDAVLFWWELDMDPRGEVILSCAPSWNHPERESQPWREHWMQAIYFPLATSPCRQGHEVTVMCSHDEYSFWFDVSSSSGPETDVHFAPPRFGVGQFSRRPQCTCGIHSICNYSRLGMLNDTNRNAKYEKLIRKIIHNGAVCLCIGETSMLPLIAALLGARKVYIIDGHPHSCRMLRSYIVKNNLEAKIKVINKMANDVSPADLDNENIDVILAEPYFTGSLLPSHNLRFRSDLWILRNFWKSETIVCPVAGELWAVAVHFEDLWKIRAPLESVENLSMAPFDKLIQTSIDLADATVEPQPLWEYKSRALSKPFLLVSIFTAQDLTDDIVEKDSIPLLSTDDNCNGVALWMDWRLDKEIVSSQGPVSPIVPGQFIDWEPNYKQGVHFFMNDECRSQNQSVQNVVEYFAKYEVLSGDMKLQFVLK